MTETAPTGSLRTGPPRRPLPWALLAVDVLLVILFGALGNREHDSGLALVDVLTTAAPFLIPLVGISCALRFWRRPSSLWPDGVVIVLGTVAVGMILRELSGTGGVQLSFVLVTLGVLGVFLLGRRLISGFIIRRRP